MECRQRIEKKIRWREIDARCHLMAIRQDVGVAEHHALGESFRAGGKEHDRRIVGRNLEFFVETFGSPSSDSTKLSSLAISRKRREVIILRILAASQAERRLAGPAEKLRSAGTRP